MYVDGYWFILINIPPKNEQLCWLSIVWTHSLTKITLVGNLQITYESNIIQTPSIWESLL